MVNMLNNNTTTPVCENTKYHLDTVAFRQLHRSLR